MTAIRTHCPIQTGCHSCARLLFQNTFPGTARSAAPQQLCSRCFTAQIRFRSRWNQMICLESGASTRAFPGGHRERNEPHLRKNSFHVGECQWVEDWRSRGTVCRLPLAVAGRKSCAKLTADCSSEATRAAKIATELTIGGTK
jgi:hypothetical protein